MRSRLKFKTGERRKRTKRQIRAEQGLNTGSSTPAPKTPTKKAPVKPTGKTAPKSNEDKAIPKQSENSGSVSDTESSLSHKKN